ncbi:Clp protease N-terminal domain-containing protein [Phytomonospora sp. NPDC050363]|uniref:Clp protease N-terminal domain-containing protein n=1 Tax=Phytomonospora sp. NPDC050363 TaxID=3155642 RepID=UPI0033D1E246
MGIEKYPVRLGDLIEYVSQQPGGPLDHLSTAAELGVYLDEVADHLMGHFVDQARRAGASWSEIGQYMGVSKQAAQKRFVDKGDKGDEGDLPSKLSGAFERFTARARSVTVQSAVEARTYGHDEVGGDHILLALVADGQGLAALALADQGADADRVRAAVLEAHPAEPGEPGEHIPFSKDGRKVLDLTLREALRYGHNYIGTEHMLLGLMRDKGGPGAEALDALGVTRERAEDWIGAALAKVAQARAE